MNDKIFTMKTGLLAILILLIVSKPASAQSVTFDYSSVGNALIQFQGQGTGGTLNISNDTLTGFAFQIANANPSGLDGLGGTITGTFEIGSYSEIGPGAQEAPVTGTGTMSIVDGSSILSAAISWKTAVTFGPFGALDYGISSSPTNLSNFTYSGTTTSVLYQLSGATSGTNVLDFTFLPPESISSLTQDGNNSATTFSGSFEAIPEPSTYSAILGVAAICLAAWRRKRGTVHQF